MSRNHSVTLESASQNESDLEKSAAQVTQSRSNEDQTQLSIFKRLTSFGVEVMAYEAGILGPDCVAAHCVHLSDNEIRLLADIGTSFSHNAGSNAKLGNGVARVQDILRQGSILG
jgi:cytosine/adenosine deaminase-related metal-dependent hydrolase